MIIARTNVKEDALDAVHRGHGHRELQTEGRRLRSPGESTLRVGLAGVVEWRGWWSKTREKIPQQRVSQQCRVGNFSVRRQLFFSSRCGGDCERAVSEL
jgi:hypothetical protein